MNSHEGKPVSRVVGEIIADTQDIMRSEVRLAKTEIREELAASARSLAVIAAGLLLAAYAFGFLLLGAVYALGHVIEPWAAAVLVGFVVGVAGAVVALVGQQRLRRARWTPTRTIATLKENIQWVKHQTR